MANITVKSFDSFIRPATAMWSFAALLILALMGLALVSIIIIMAVLLVMVVLLIDKEERERA